MVQNLKYYTPDYIPIVFQSLNGNDGHLFTKELRKKFNKSDIAVPAKNKENISLNVKINFKMAEMSSE